MQLRNSLVQGGSQTFGASINVENHNEADGYDSGANDFGDDIPHDMYMDEDLPFHQEQVRQLVLTYQQQNNLSIMLLIC